MQYNIDLFQTMNRFMDTAEVARNALLVCNGNVEGAVARLQRGARLVSGLDSLDLQGTKLLYISIEQIRNVVKSAFVASSGTFGCLIS